MNNGLTIGAIVFLLWSTFSSWYYVCKIKGLCLEPTVEVEAPIETENLEIPDPVPVVEKVEDPILSPISLTVGKIYFEKNSTDFIDPNYVENETAIIKSQIEGREVAISIVGYTCDLGRKQYNQQLGLRRAEAMQSFLVNNHIEKSIINISSKGEAESQSGTEEQRQKDRKVTISIKSTDQ